MRRRIPASWSGNERRCGHGGKPAGLAAESAAQAVRNAGFVIPAGIGVQEGGYVLGGSLAGIGAEAALAVALVKRARATSSWGFRFLFGGSSRSCAA